MRYRSVLIAAVIVTACGGRAQVRHPGESYLSKIEITGNHFIKSKDLIEGLALHRAEKAGRGVDDYELGVDKTRIEGEYYRRGFFAAAVRSQVVAKGEAVTVIFTVDEGVRATTHVEIIGLPPDVDPAKARKLVALADDGPFDYDAYDDAKAPLLRLVQDAGYARAQLEASVIADKSHHQATVQYAFDPDKRCTFGAIDVTGATGALAQAAKDRVAFEQGDTYSATKVIDTQRALYEFNRFSTVRVEPVTDGDATTIPVKISVAEGNRHELQVGGGGGLDPLNYSIRFPVAKYSVAGWPFALSTASVDARVALTALRDECKILDFISLQCHYDPLVRLIGTLVEQDLLFTNARGTIEGGADYLTIEPFRSISAHVKLDYSLPVFTPKLQGHLGWLLEGAHFDTISPAIDAAEQHALGIDHFERLGEYQQSLVLDLRDHPANPRLGLYAEMRVAEGGEFAGSAYDFIQLSPEIRGFVPIGPLVLATKFRYSEIHGDVPPTERYFGGGASSQRGFPERELSPIATAVVDGVTDTVIIGGAALIETGAELRIPLPKRFGLVTFVDGGDVTNSASELSIHQLNWAVGIGVRFFLLPVGPFRFDVAYRTGSDRTDQPMVPHWNYFLSVGEAF